MINGAFETKYIQDVFDAYMICPHNDPRCGALLSKHIKGKKVLSHVMEEIMRESAFKCELLLGNGTECRHRFSPRRFLPKRNFHPFAPRH